MSKKNNKIPFRERKKSKKVAGLLGIFLGAFGIHNFYLGKYVRGILQFILALIFIFTLKDNAEFLIDSLLMLGSLGVGKGIAILCNEVDINKKYRLKHASKEENIEYATSALKKFPATDSSLYIDYVSKNTTLSATDIKEIINKEKATINKRNQEIDDLKKQLEQEKKDKENEILNNPQDEIQQEKSNLEQVPTLNEENKQEQVNVTNGISNHIGTIIGVIILVVIGVIIFIGLGDTANDVSNNINESISISSEQKENLLKLWNKVSNFGTSNLKRVALNYTALGDYELYLEYFESSRNGKYVIVSSQGFKIYYGDQNDGIPGATITKKELMDTTFKLFDTSTEDIVLTAEEFKAILKKK